MAALVSTMTVFLAFCVISMTWAAKSVVTSDDGSLPCNLKQYGDGKFVCVCNSTYCDKLEAVQIPSLGQFKVWTSTRDGQRFDVGQGIFQKFQKTTASAPSLIPTAARNVQGTITIERNQKFQTILGFGGAFTDATGVNVLHLPEGAQANFFESYFGRGGIGYSLCRVPMGGADFSERNYTYDDHPGDENLDLFALQPEDFNYKIPFIKKAMSLSPTPIRLLASPWSAPPWVKTNGKINGRGWLKREYWTYWANYFVKFLTAYKDNELNFWGVTTQNEPSTGFIPLYPFNAMGWEADWMRDFIVNDLGPILRQNFPDTKILIFDDNTVSIKQWADTILTNKTAADYIYGVGFHWYSNSVTGYGPIRETRADYPDAILLPTEACNGFLPWEIPKVSPGSWERGEAYAEDVLQGLASGTVGWIDWNLALNLEGGPNWAGLAADSTITVNASSGEFYKQPTFHALGHAAKFFQPGSKVIFSSIQLDPIRMLLCADCVRAVAVQNPDTGSVAVYILNKGSEDLTIVLSDSVQGEATIVLEKRSMKTIIYK